MANISVLNKIMRLQKLLLPINAHYSFLACSTYASQVLLQNQRSMHVRRLQHLTEQQQQAQSKPQQLHNVRHYSNSNKTESTNDSSTTSATTGTETTPPTIDEFRAREEQREKEFELQEQTKEEQRQKESEEEAKNAKLKEIRYQILEAAMLHVPTLGWTRKAIVQGAEDAGFPSVVHGMFPEGGFALVSHFVGKCNDELAQRLQEQTQNAENPVSNIPDFLVHAIRLRLEMIIPYKAQWPQALALIAMPQNAPTALAQVLTLVDDICYYSGDRSVDFAWYMRRVGLATILKMTELYMLQDKSTEHEKTWEFLKNRMDEAIKIQSALQQGDNLSQDIQRSFNTAFITARNILGLNYNRR